MPRGLPLFTFLWAFCAVGVSMAQPSPDYKPELAQSGKDVVWVPTPDALVNRMLDLAQLSARDYLIDLGSGDGRLVIMAAKRGAQGHGIEYSADLVALSQRTAQRAGVEDKATFAKADLFDSDFSKATVVTLFLGPDLNRKLMSKLLNLKPGTRIVSNTHPIGDWPADESAESADDENTVYYRNALLWIVPAKVAGAWRFAGGSVNFRQRYQRVSGSVTLQGKSAPVTSAKLRGDEIRFSAGGAQFSGKVNGDVIAGTVTTGGASREWRAERAR